MYTHATLQQLLTILIQSDELFESISRLPDGVSVN